MRTVKIILLVVLSVLILTQLFAIINKIGNPEVYNLGFIVGKILIIGAILLVGKVMTKMINQKME